MNKDEILEMLQDITIEQLQSHKYVARIYSGLSLIVMCQS